MSLQEKINETKKEITGERKSLGIDGGKGSRPRNNFSKSFRNNYDAIFKKTKKKDPEKPSLTSPSDS